MTNKDFISEVKDLTLLVNVNVNKLTHEEKACLIFQIQNMLLDLCTIKIEQSNLRLKAYNDEKKYLAEFVKSIR